MSKSSTKLNFVYNTIYQLFQIILPLLTAPYIARVVGAKGVGIYSYQYSIVNYFMLVAMLGINTYGNRSIASIRDNYDKRNEVFSEIYTLQIITSTISIFCYILYLLFIVKNNKLIATIQIINLISVILDVNWLFFGLEQFKITATRSILIKISTVIFIFLFVKDTNDLWKYTAIMSVGYFFAQAFLWINIRKYISFVKVPFRRVANNLKPTLLLFFPVIATSIYRILDKIMLGLMSSMIEVGLYENAEKMMMVSLGVMTSLGTVMLPKMSNLVAKGKIKECKKYLIKSMQMAMFMASAISFGLAAIAREFAPLFFGIEFNESGRIMVGLAPTVLCIAWANVIRTQYLIPNSKDRIYLTSVCIGSILNVVTNILLIKDMGAMGAVVGTILAEFSVAIYQTVVSRKELDVVIYLKNSFVFIVSGAFMYLVIRLIAKYMRTSILSLIVEVIVGGLIYIVITMIYFIKTKNEMILGILFRIFPRFKNGKYCNICQD